MQYDVTFISGTVLDERTACSLKDLCAICNVSAEIIHEMIDEGLIVPMGENPLHWQFGYQEIRRIQTALRLQRDLRINLPGCALALDLLDKLEELQHRL